MTDAGSTFMDVRVAAVQYPQQPIAHRDEFAAQLRHWVRVAADYDCDFVLFPELFTLQLLSLPLQPAEPADAVDRLTTHTPWLIDLFRRLAVDHRINIVAGSHLTRVDGGAVRNVCQVALRDGSVHLREKLHPTPSERAVWSVQGADAASVIHTDRGPIGVAICYDAEFPELARHLVDQGAELLFVPFCTDVRQGYLRVRYCCQARAVENQCYVIAAGNVGSIAGVDNFDIQYAQSAVFTPCDFPFPPDGIAGIATENRAMPVIADLSLRTLRQFRDSGTVLNLKDRRHDLYASRWLGASASHPEHTP